jgi:HEAT repeat protein
MQNDRKKNRINLTPIFLVPFLCLAVLSTASLAAESSQAEMWLFLTKDGDRIIGQLTNPDEEPRTKYLIKTPDGKELNIAEKEMRNRRPAKDHEVEYAKRKATVADTVKAQWELAEWCREQRMSTPRKTHLQRVIELDPDHKEARSALGYRKVGDKWMTQEEYQASRGYYYYNGKWRTKQEIASLKKDKKLEKQEKKWYVSVKRYVGWLGTQRTDEALKAFAEIKDPAAIRAIDGFLAGDQPRDVKLLLIKVMDHIRTANPDNHGTHLPLALSAYDDPDEEVRLSCLDILKKTKDPNVTDYFVGKLNVTLATRKYKGDANMMINRAAHVLGELGDDKAVQPLIHVLITEHKKKVTSGKAGQTSASFNNQGGGGLSMGSSSKIISYEVENQDVLAALKKLTGVSFNFDIDRWQAWYDHKNQQSIPDTRRGPN